MQILPQHCPGCRKLTEELEDSRHETLAAMESARVAKALIEALAERLRVRHHEIRCLRKAAA